uniref:Retrotransposon Copia-like N-terminal domain-containing protein n=1 Tax=Vitis vinifera TaxID=29760 RepID=A5BEE1_VITVI|nr:hypothetical protein VITISV_018008 [Vitis vinifera]
MRARDKGERIGGEELHSRLWRGREQIRGRKREKEERGGREREGEGKGRLSHVLGIKPKRGDPTFEEWDKDDSMIMSWLWDSMNLAVSDTHMFLTIAKEIWDSICRTYSKACDAAQVYEIKVKTSATKQGSRTVTECANSLKNLWQELDHYRVSEMKCLKDTAILKNFIEKDRVYDFLAGLNPEFDQVRVQILGKEETISLIRVEES